MHEPIDIFLDVKIFTYVSRENDAGGFVGGWVGGADGVSIVI